MTEQINNAIYNGPRVRYNVLDHDNIYAPDIVSTTDYVDYAHLDIRKLQPGGYKIKIYVTAPDDELITEAKTAGGAWKISINRESPTFENFEHHWGGTFLPLYFKQNTQNPWEIIQYRSSTTPQSFFDRLKDFGTIIY
jgi:hypothetical protein